MRVIRAAALSALLAMALVHATPAQAASPSTGIISRAKPALSWKGGPFLLPRPVGCLGPSDPTCDYFFLRVNLEPGTEVEIKMTTPRGSPPSNAPIGSDDFDIYVWGPNDEILAEGATDSGNETIRFTHSHKLRNYVYEIEVVPFLVQPGTSYTARARAVQYTN